MKYCLILLLNWFTNLTRLNYYMIILRMLSAKPQPVIFICFYDVCCLHVFPEVSHNFITFKYCCLISFLLQCYIDPSTGFKFYSKPQVSQYLKSIKPSSHSNEQKKKGFPVQSEKKVCECSHIYIYTPTEC